jgi:hypothetical protein
VVTVFDADTLRVRCQAILAAIVAAGDALPRVTPLPARQLVSSGGVTWDCEMLFVSALTVQTGLPETVETPVYGGVNTFPQGNMTAWTVTVECGVVRKLLAQPTVVGPSQRAPSTDAYLADLTAVSADTAVLFNAAQALVAASFQPVPQSAAMLAPQGGFHGVAATLTVELWPAP